MSVWLTASEQLCYAGDMVRIGSGAGFVVFGSDKEGERLASGHVVGGQGVVLSRTGRKILTPGHGGRLGLSIKEGDQDFIASLRGRHSGCDKSESGLAIGAVEILRSKDKFMAERFAAYQLIVIGKK